MPKTILLAGATGLIGSALIKSFVLRGDNILLLTRDSVSASKMFPDAKKIVQWNEIDSLKDESIDGIINLAGRNLGAKRWNDSIRQQLYDSRISSTKRIVELIRNMTHKPGVLLNASGVDYYGNTGAEEMTEDSPAGDTFAARLTIDWEAEAKKAESSGVHVVLVRTGVVLAHDSPALKKMLLPFRFFAGGYPGNGKQYFSWIHINDIVRIYIFLLDNESINGAVNACSPEPVPIKQFCKELGYIMHRPSYMSAPAFLLRLAYGEMSELVLHGRKAVPKKLLDHGFEFKFTQVHEALKTIL